MKEKVVLIDGHNLLFRMFYGIPSPIVNSKGIDIRGLVGFLGSIRKLIHTLNPDYIAVIFDSETSKNANIQLDENYKGQRIDYSQVEESDNPFTCYKKLREALDMLKIENYEVAEYEADDFIASIVMQNANKEYIIVSTDTDFFQLIRDNVKVYVPRGKLSILYDREAFMERYSLVPEQYVFYKALVGDKSDNISGVRGIGKKYATKVAKYNSILAYVAEHSNTRISKMLVENAERINLNRKLITLHTSLDTSFIKGQQCFLRDFKAMQVIEQIGMK